MKHSHEHPFPCIDCRGTWQAQFRTEICTKGTNWGTEGWEKWSVMVQISDAEQRHPLTVEMSIQIVWLEPYLLWWYKSRVQLMMQEGCCSGGSLFRIWIWESTGHAWACRVSFMWCTICVMELHIIQGMRQFIKFCKQETLWMKYSHLKAAQKSVFEIIFLFFVLATAIHKINYPDFKEQNAIVTQKYRRKK